MNSFKLEIVTPTEINEVENASYVRCPATDGSFGIMKGHREAVIALGVGEIKITEEGKDSYFATSGGVAEISKDKVQFLLETIEVANDIDSDRAKASMQRSKDRLSNKKDNDINRAELSLLKALNRLKVSSR
ncbi:MAG: ATP synthase F1 subunit epsilon [Candidatus Marinimicrobia bacterium]|jgi:F-type H+-transporting ATPase subunit epsilon|nr:ATP synthase F1 subunit epsilon [Candidatus Neomarinimicrobiota bacterium]MDG2367082.1 ATP synthase F1 subunit epsilon [Candidatus Neomarinimicrobiota bacterium]|tara:strand:- start:3069 stop:3464 length:396 start_codon:yes stop_codon:yes gene_type:complete